MSNEHLTDDEIRALLKILDESEAECTAWEGDFLESILYQWKGKLTAGQRASALQMIETYERFL